MVVHGNITNKINCASTASRTHHIFGPSLSENNMSTKTTFQCPNCKRLFSKQCSLKLHLPSCRWMHLAVEDSHHQIDHHPLRSSHYVDNASSLNDDEYSYGAINDNNDDESVDSIFFRLIHPSPQMILLTPTGSLTITKKHNNNRVQQLRNYKSSSII